MTVPKKPKYYVVWNGRKTGIFTTWEGCSAQVNGYPGAEYKSFPSREAAEQAWRGKYEDYKGQTASGMRQQWLLADHKPQLPSYSVDAACSGNPGVLEYRCVDTATGEQIFKQGPFQHGTNNVGEFLAIVDALALLEEQDSNLPIYSDSATAIGWVKRKNCNTRLVEGERNSTLFGLVRRAEAWLKRNDYVNEILKWDTDAWGEIPADFGRK